MDFTFEMCLKIYNSPENPTYFIYGKSLASSLTQNIKLIFPAVRPGKFEKTLDKYRFPFFYVSQNVTFSGKSHIFYAEYFFFFIDTKYEVDFSGRHAGKFLGNLHINRVFVFCEVSMRRRLGGGWVSKIKVLD